MFPEPFLFDCFDLLVFVYIYIYIFNSFSFTPPVGFFLDDLLVDSLLMRHSRTHGYRNNSSCICDDVFELIGLSIIDVVFFFRLLSSFPTNRIREIFRNFHCFLHACVTLYFICLHICLGNLILVEYILLFSLFILS